MHKVILFTTIHLSPCISCILKQSLEVCIVPLPYYKYPPRGQISSSKAYVSLVAPQQYAASKLPPSEKVLSGKRVTRFQCMRTRKYLFRRLKTTITFNLLLCWKTRIVAPEPRAPLIIELWFNESLIINPPCKNKINCNSIVTYYKTHN